MNAPTKKHGVRKVILDNNAKLAILLETKVKTENCAAVFDSFISNWKYLHNGEVGSTARIWVGWDSAVLKVEEILKSDQFIHLKVTTLGSSLSYLCTAVYASNSVEERRVLWRDVTSFGSSISGPWIALGDFNIVRQQSLQKLLFCSPGLSDHSPAVISILDGVNFGPKPFRFFEAWIGREGFDEVVAKGWDSTVNMKLNPILRFAARLKNVKTELKKWNKDSIGDVFLAVKEASLDLAQIQISLAAHPNDLNLVSLETAAKKKLWAALNTEEKFLKEKSRVKNIQLGDGNNSFFHKSMVCRQNRNHILEVYNAENEVIKDPNLIKEEAISFYMNLFGANVEDVGFFPETVPLQHSLDLVQQNSLIGQVSNKEIREVVFSMKNSKAPGPDGFGAAFFKHAWEVVGEDLTLAVKWFFLKSSMPTSINATFISLIPKTDNTSSFTGYRPIALCNLFYKIITKVLSNRLQGVVGKVVSDNQSAFIKGRSIVDNILVCHDVVRGIEQKGTPPTAVLKIDLHKAYDSLSRKFLFEIMERMGFPSKFIRWVKACVDTPSFSILLNGSPTGYFRGKRGIRQGDPLSPYLFTIAMEGFSALMRKLEVEGQISLLPRCKSSHLTHLIFADDLMIFVKAVPDSILACLGALSDFHTYSGLRLNRAKSSIILGGLTQTARLQLLELTNFVDTKLPIRYLGVPLVPRKLSMADCSAILDLVRRRLDGGKLVSYPLRDGCSFLPLFLAAIYIGRASLHYLVVSSKSWNPCSQISFGRAPPWNERMDLVPKLGFCATVHYIWWERNQRLFENKVRTHDQIIEAIRLDVAIKCAALSHFLVHAQGTSSWR
ncbi:uncharacterized protein LOC122648107 [Telopea speciosissima]|uniref:uncharacterized protein LOC122648107 n=1 Tax=Telopea speciosissima TaxID=54955 RepID=UPI001CC3D077|nr:uncharacterized protein LOC122648107 [Telopea speciosissima]